MARDQIGESMTDDEIDSLLSTLGNGVLSLADDGRAYGVPISYAYDSSDGRIVMEFVNFGESKKQQFAEQSKEVTLTVHNFEDRETWESVIVTGTIHPIDPEEVSDRLAAQFFFQADDAAGELRWLDTETLDRVWYELRPTDVTGRHGGTLPHKQPKGLVRFSGYDRTY